MLSYDIIKVPLHMFLLNINVVLFICICGIHYYSKYKKLFWASYLLILLKMLWIDVCGHVIHHWVEKLHRRVWNTTGSVKIEHAQNFISFFKLLWFDAFYNVLVLLHMTLALKYKIEALNFSSKYCLFSSRPACLITAAKLICS